MATFPIPISGRRFLIRLHTQAGIIGSMVVVYFRRLDQVQNHLRPSLDRDIHFPLIQIRNLTRIRLKV